MRQRESIWFALSSDSKFSVRAQSEVSLHLKAENVRRSSDRRLECHATHLPRSRYFTFTSGTQSLCTRLLKLESDTYGL